MNSLKYKKVKGMLTILAISAIASSAMAEIPLRPETPAVPVSITGNTSTEVIPNKKPEENDSILKKAASLFGVGKKEAPRTKKTEPKRSTPIKPKKIRSPKKAKRAVKKKPVKAIPVIHVRSGPNYIIPVAVGHANRIVTPFHRPKVVTSTPSDDADINTKRNVVYVTPFNSSPVTMFIKEGDNEDTAISITLAPKKIAPVITKIVISGSPQRRPNRAQVTRKSFREYKAPKEAVRWEKSEGYESTLKKLLRITASGYTPPGYKMRRLVRGVDENPSCSQAGIVYSLAGGYVMQGNHFNVQILKASNRTNKAIQIQENQCSNSNIAAAAAWPNNLLQPGQSTEFYVVYINRKKSSNGKTRRPSLID